MFYYFGYAAYNDNFVGWITRIESLRGFLNSNGYRLFTLPVIAANFFPFPSFSMNFASPPNGFE